MGTLIREANICLRKIPSFSTVFQDSRKQWVHHTTNNPVERATWFYIFSLDGKLQSKQKLTDGATGSVRLEDHHTIQLPLDAVGQVRQSLDVQQLFVNQVQVIQRSLQGPAVAKKWTLTWAIAIVSINTLRNRTRIEHCAVVANTARGKERSACQMGL